MSQSPYSRPANPLQLLIVLVFYTSMSVPLHNRPLAAGSTIEVQCPYTGVRQFASMPTLALLLTNAQKNMSIYASAVEPGQLAIQSMSMEAGQEMDSGYRCQLNRTNKICSFSSYSTRLQLQCSSTGTVTLTVLQPYSLTAAIARGEPLRQQVLNLHLQPNETGILIFKLDFSLLGYHRQLGDILLGNCIEFIEYYQQELLVAVRGSSQASVVMVTDGVTGQWVFTRRGRYFEEMGEPAEGYVLAAGRSEHEINRGLGYEGADYYGFKLLLRTENVTAIRLIDMQIRVWLNISDPLISKKQQIVRVVRIPAGRLQSKPPIKLSFFFQQHPIILIQLVSNIPLHYLIQLSQPRLRQNKHPPVMQQDQYLYYFYEQLSTPLLPIQAHLVKSYRDNLTPELMVRSEGVTRLAGRYGPEDKEIQVKGDKIEAIAAKDSNSYAQISLTVQPEKLTNSQAFTYFMLMLQTSDTPTRLYIGQEITEYLFDNELKRYLIPKQATQALTTTKLLIKCPECNLYSTYDPQCQSINCCQRVTSGYIDAKPVDLYLIVKASREGGEETAVVRLQVLDDDKGFLLRGGVPIQSLLRESDTYIYHSSGKEDIEIVCNTDSQSILLLASFKQFPTMNNFEYQSNEGYIRIPATYSNQVLYLKLIKMLTSMSMSYYNYQIPYLLVVAGSSDEIRLKQGRPYGYTMHRNGSRGFRAELSEGPGKYYLRVSLRGHSTGTLAPSQQPADKLKLNLQSDSPNSTTLTSLICQQSTLDLSPLLCTHSCNLSLLLMNLAPQPYHLSILLFKQNISFQAITGQFMHYHTLIEQDTRLYCIVDPYRGVNVYAYADGEIGIEVRMVGVRDGGMVAEVLERIGRNESGGEDEADYSSRGYRELARVSESAPSHSQYIHLPPAAQYFPRRQPYPSFVLITLRKHPTSAAQGQDISLVCTHNETIMQASTRLQYRLNHEQSHRFRLPLNRELLALNPEAMQAKNPNNEKQLVIQTTKLDGSYSGRVGVSYLGVVIGELDMGHESQHERYPTKFTRNVPSIEHESVIIVKVQKIHSILSKYLAQHTTLKSLTEVSFESLYLQFNLTCHKSPQAQCLFLTSLQSSQSSLRVLTPGIPQIFHINKHSSIIFIYSNNIHDNEFKFKVNRKLGLPKYKLCSYRPLATPNSVKQNKCLAQLQVPSNQHLLIDENQFNTDSNLIIGRTHQLIINQYNQQYCTNCSYYLALYSDYDVLQGSIFVMSANQPTYLEEGSSITTIVYRGGPDKYMLVDWGSMLALVYEIEGRVEVAVDGEGEGEGGHFIVKASSSDNQTEGEALEIHLNSSEAKHKGKYQLSISPAHNSPSALYTLIIVNRNEHTIALKDGVPYETKYSMANYQTLNSVIHYKYRCENEGVIMISTKNFEQIEITVRCEDSMLTGDPHTNNQGRLIDIADLLKVSKMYKMSNRLDLNINPSICIRYKVSIVAKTITATYTVLVSSTDIITLPLHREVPGVLKYQTKLYQIYEILVNEKTEVRCIFKFCQGGDGRIMVARSKKDIYTQIYQQEMDIHEETTYETLHYMAKPGFFYIKVEFKGRGGRLQYTIHAENIGTNDQPQQLESGTLRLFWGVDLIDYQVQRVGANYTQYAIEFYPIVQGQGSRYEIEYYLVESTKVKLLKKTENCNGQYFVEFVNHHEEIRETKINVSREVLEVYAGWVRQEGEGNTPALRKQQQELGQSDDDDSTEEQQMREMKSSGMAPIRFDYRTSTPYTFITIIPIIYSPSSHQFYHRYIPKYRQIQLKNGQLFANFAYLLSQSLSRIETIIDIHGSQNLLLAILGIAICACVILLVLGGVWLGARFCWRTRTVYVMKEIRQEEEEDEGEDEDNRVAGMARDGDEAGEGRARGREGDEVAVGQSSAGQSGAGQSSAGLDGTTL